MKKKQNLYKEELLHKHVEFPRILSSEKFTSSTVDKWNLWRIFFLVAFFCFITGFWLGIAVAALIAWFYYSISSVELSVRPTDEGVKLLIKENTKRYELLAPLEVNTLWKSEINRHDKSSETFVFLQLRDANGVLVTFYERRVLDGRFPYESKHTQGSIQEPDFSFKIQRVDLLMKYLGMVLPDDLVSYKEDLNT